MEKKKKKKIIFIVILVIILLIAIIGITLFFQKKAKEKEIGNYTSISQFRSVEELLIYMQCKYKGEEKSKTEGYDLDVYVQFRYPLEDKDYVEVFYEKLVNNISYVTGYLNLRLIDEENKVTVEIMANKENKTLSSVKINGIENYFERLDSEKQLQNYEKVEYTNMTVNSPYLQACVQNNWVSSKINFGGKESSIDGYDIYFDEGMEVRNIQFQVYNLVFTKKYKGEVVNGIKVGDSVENVISKLGTPYYGNSNYYPIGYVTKDFVIFFDKEEVSVYYVDRKTKTNKFEELLAEFIQTDDEKKFINQLTDLWKDYTQYTYDATYVTITYATKGFSITYNNGDFDGITFYPNYQGKIVDGKTIAQIKAENIELPKRVRIVTDKVKDIFYQQHQSRRLRWNYYEHCIMGEEESNTTNRSNEFIMADTKEPGNNIKIISKNGNYPNSEFPEHTDIQSWLWVNDNYAFYSIANKGIYLYEATTRGKGTVIEGTENYKLEKYENHILTYDNGKQIQVNF